jgi:hypothetical protein
VLGDQILLNNLSRTPVVILDPAGRPFIRVPTGESHTWHDTRVVSSGDPPADAQVVKQWRIPGRAGAKRFEITGFLGWIPPPESADEGVSRLVLAGAAFGLVALSLAGVFLLGRRS